MNLSYWLVPESRSSEALKGTIEELARRFEAPVFEPHVTVYSGSGSEDEAPRQLEAAMRLAALPPMAVTAVRHSPVFTKSLYLELEPSPEIASLCESLRRGAARPSDYRLEPHLSLMYRCLEPSSLAELAAEVRRSEIVAGPICVSELVAVAHGGVTSARDVLEWQVVARRSLLDP